MRAQRRRSSFTFPTIPWGARHARGLPLRHWARLIQDQRMTPARAVAAGNFPQIEVELGDRAKPGAD